MEKNLTFIKLSSPTVIQAKGDAKVTKQDQIDQIDLLEVYVEKSRAIGLGQRLLWHLDKFNKKISLPYIPGARDLYLQPLSVKYKDEST